MKIGKRVLSILLAALMLAAVLPTFALAVDGIGGSHEWDVGAGGNSNGLGADYYTVVYKAGDNGSLEGISYERVKWGETPADVPEATADEGYEFIGWTRDGEMLEDPEDMTIKETTVMEAIFIVPLLNKTAHDAYMQGYPDKSFKLEEKITRAEAATVFYNLLADKAVDITASFTDVAEGEWYTTAICTLATLGIFTGYDNGDGTFCFKPDDNIERGEFAAMMARVQMLRKGGVVFTDVAKDHWAMKYIQSVVAEGWFDVETVEAEDEDAAPAINFRPDEDITRIEVVTAMNNLLERAADASFIAQNEAKLVSFTDVDSADGAVYYEVMEATNSHEFKKDVSGEVWTALK